MHNRKAEVCQLDVSLLVNEDVVLEKHAVSV